MTTKNKKDSSDFLNKLLVKSGNPFATLADNETLSLTTDWIDTGSLALNGLISSDINKGIPNNKITAFAGESGSGKTYLVLSIAKQAIKKGYKILFFDSENTLEKEMLEKRGIDPMNVGIIPVDTVESFRDQMIAIINEYNSNKEKDKQKIMIILDSLGNLSTKKEIEDSEKQTGKKDMTRAQLIKSVFRILQLKLAQSKIPLLMTNHVYADVGSFFPSNKIAGGGGLIYSASVIITLTRSKVKDAKKNVVGFYFNCKTFKNRFCKPESSLKIYLDFKRGLHKYFGLQDFGLPLLEKVSGGWVYKDEKIKEKALWNLDWKNETELLKIVHNNIYDEFSFGSENVGEAELSSEVDE